MAENPLLALPHADADRARVEDELRAAVEAPTAAMTEMAGHLLGAGGKRVRPLLRHRRRRLPAPAPTAPRRSTSCAAACRSSSSTSARSTTTT